MMRTRGMSLDEPKFDEGSWEADDQLPHLEDKHG